MVPDRLTRLSASRGGGRPSIKGAAQLVSARIASRPLKFAGLQRSSLVDFPKRVACVLFTQGCNLSCAWCHNGTLIPLDSASGDCDPQRILEFIASRKGLMEGVVISGGEPLLQNGLLQFLEKVKQLGMRVKLDTNGTLPHRLRCLLQRHLIDYLALDIKAPLDETDAYRQVVGAEVDPERVRESAAMLVKDAPNGEFRTTVLPGFHTFARLERLLDSLPEGPPHCFQPFLPYHARSDFWRRHPTQSPSELQGLVSELQRAFPQRKLIARV